VEVRKPRGVALRRGDFGGGSTSHADSEPECGSSARDASRVRLEEVERGLSTILVGLRAIVVSSACGRGRGEEGELRARSFMRCVIVGTRREPRAPPPSWCCAALLAASGSAEDMVTQVCIDSVCTMGKEGYDMSREK
jgi:hypothetical protein